MTYRISYKHDEHGSDSLGCDFTTVAAAKTGQDTALAAELWRRSEEWVA